MDRPRGWDRDDAHTVAHYTELLSRYDDHRAVGFNTEESQHARFAALAGIAPLEGRSVLDVGCGTGDFLGWLRRRGVNVDYHGLDLTPGMIEAARGRYPDARFDVGEILDPASAGGRTFDFVFASGIFTYRKRKAFPYLKTTVAALYGRCAVGCAFNTLTRWVPGSDPGEFHAPPGRTLEFCGTLTPWVALRHDYHPHDFTVYLYLRATPTTFRCIT